MGKPKVLLGMSGGTDSSVAAILLQEQGYEVVGVTLWLFDDFNNPGKEPPFIAEARLLSQKLGIKHIVVEAKKDFEAIVLDNFLNEYLSGRTPFPCIVCNKHIKWKLLEQVALANQCDKIATGHYVRIVEYQARKYFANGYDSDKDQSFFLWNLNTHLIDKIIFPLGEMNKTDVRALAAQKGFKTVAEKKDSLGVCFIEGGNYRPFLQQLMERNGINVASGKFITSNGVEIGTHNGFPFYTIGQRRGLNHKQNQPMFVNNINAAENTVTLGNFQELFKNKIMASGYHFYYQEDVSEGQVFIVKIRYRNQATPCTVEVINEDRIVIHLLEPLNAIAPGQSAVFFVNNRVVGGAVIDNAL